MKRLMTTAGLAALGAATVAPGLAQDLSTDKKPWAIGGTIRGFYDDNYYVFSGKTGFPRRDSFGFEVNPQASYNLHRDQTDVGLSYQYGFRYYFDRPSPKDDQSHQVNARLNHAFNEKYTVDASDSFVIAQEPAVLEPNGLGGTVTRRSEGNNVRNQARVGFNANVLEHFNVQLGYSNTIYDYEEDAGKLFAQTGTTVGSHSAVLDRVEHLFTADIYYQVLPKTQVGLSYNYQIMDFTSNDQYVPGIPGTQRDYSSHFLAVGFIQNLNQNFTAAAKVGAQFTQYEDETTWKNSTIPFADANIRWNYAQGSSWVLGVRHSRIPSDVALANAGGGKVAGPASDAEATSIYTTVNQQITPKITLGLQGQYQYSAFTLTTGASDFSDNLLYVGANVSYEITKNVSAELAYAFDRLDSDIVFRSYYRNRIWAGVRLSF